MFQHKVSPIILWWPGCLWPRGCDLWSKPDSGRTLFSLRRLWLNGHVMSEYRSPAPCTEFIRISLRQSLPLYTQGHSSILKKDKQLSNLYWYHWEAKAAPISKYGAIEWTSNKSQVQTTVLSINHWASLLNVKCRWQLWRHISSPFLVISSVHFVLCSWGLNGISTIIIEYIAFILIKNQWKY